MPQISPISWLIIIFTLLFTCSIIINNFNPFSTNPTNKISLNNSQNNLSW